MFFSRKGKLKKEFDERLVRSIKDSKLELNNARVLEDLSEEMSLDIVVQTKVAESLYFYLLKEARIRKVIIK